MENNYSSGPISLSVIFDLKLVEVGESICAFEMMLYVSVNIFFVMSGCFHWKNQYYMYTVSCSRIQHSEKAGIYGDK